MIDEDGKRLLSRRVANDEQALRALLAEVTALAEDRELTWATDLNHGGIMLLISLWAVNGQSLLYIPGRTVHHAVATYRGDGKTDAKDAAIIADQARMRRDLQPMRAGDEVSAELRLLIARCADLICDRTRAINRLRASLMEYSPALEAAFDYAGNKTALLLLTNYQTPGALRRVGMTRLTSWLTCHGGRNCARVAQQAIDAALAQRTTIAAEGVGADIVRSLAGEVRLLFDAVEELEERIDTRLHDHEADRLLLSMPGLGPLLAAEFLAATGGDLTLFETADRLAGVAGLAPAPRDSGRVSGNNHRPKRYDRRLLRACYLAALSAVRCSPTSKAFYDRKRSEGKAHVQAVLALARRRVNVIWAMFRDHTPHQPPVAADPH